MLPQGSNLGLLRGRNHAKLLHQAHHVQLSPELHDSSVDDPVEDAAWRFDALAGWRDAL
jgi:hypothetical protein